MAQFLIIMAVQKGVKSEAPNKFMKRLKRNDTNEIFMSVGAAAEYLAKLGVYKTKQSAKASLVAAVDKSNRKVDGTTWSYI